MTATGIPLTAPTEKDVPSVFNRLRDWAVTVDHKQLGVMYIVFALGFLVVGGIEATLIRLQLAVANNHVVSAHAFNVLFTMHGLSLIHISEPTRLLSISYAVFCL